MFQSLIMQRLLRPETSVSLWLRAAYILSSNRARLTSSGGAGGIDNLVVNIDVFLLPETFVIR